ARLEDQAGSKDTETQALLRLRAQNQRIKDYNDTQKREVDETNKLILDSDLKLKEQRIKVTEDLAKRTEDIRAAQAEKIIQDQRTSYEEEIALAAGNWQEQNRLHAEMYDQISVLLQA